MYSTIRGVYAGCYDVFVASGATASEIKLLSHVSRVGLDTLHVLGGVIYVYEFDVNTCWCICVLGD